MEKRAAMEAPIMGTAFPDIDMMERCHKARRDGMKLAASYGGSEDKNNFAIMPPEVMIGKKDQKANYTNDTSAELGVTAVPGLWYGEGDIEIIMRQYYFIGVPTDEWYYHGENMYNTDSLDHGIGVLKSGKITIKNTYCADISAGDWIAWRFPRTRDGDPGTQNAGNKNGRRTLDNGLNPRKTSTRNRNAPFEKPRVEIEKFNPLDFSFQLSGVFWTLTRTVEKGGIMDMKMQDYLDTPNRFSTIQQEAFNWATGLRTIAVINDDPANQEQLSLELGLYGAKEGITDDALTFLKDVFRRNTVPGQNENIAYITGSWGNNNDTKLDYLKDNVLTMLTKGISGNIMSKLSRVIGKAASSAGPGKSLDILLIGARLGI